jgi:3'-phosphoadenosine 5'-phosphosulfate sulfotransferase (PAPS reductase)/FAD synthetase
VLRKIIAGQVGDSTVITVDGNVEFKETIKVTKSSATPLEIRENYTVEVGIHKTQKMESEGFMGVNIWTSGQRFAVMNPLCLIGWNQSNRKT